MSIARSGAVTSNTRTTVAGDQGWNSGWEVFVDSNNDGIRSADERLISTHDKVPDVYIIPNKPLKKYVSFIGSGEARMIGAANGGAKQMGTFRICPVKRGVGYMLVLSGGGRVRKSEISAQECSVIISKL
jgi:type IV fimbrial biogenesis protein FimT